MDKAQYLALLSQTMLEPEGRALSTTYANRTKKNLRRFWKDAAEKYITHTYHVDLSNEALKDNYQVITEADLEAEGTVKVFIRSTSVCTGFGAGRNRLQFDDYEINKSVLFEFLK